jgi:hypothetical protein
MVELKKELRLYLRHYKETFIILTMIILVSFSINSILSILINKNFQITYSNFSSLMFYNIIFIIFPFTNQFQVFPQYIGMGGTRREFLKNSMLFNFFGALIIDFFLNIIYMITNYSITSLPFGEVVSRFMLNYISTMGFTVCAIGICTFVASIFYKKGILYGFASILFIMSPIVLFIFPLVNYFMWADNLIIGVLGTFIIGILAIPASWIFIKRAEVK